MKRLTVIVFLLLAAAITRAAPPQVSRLVRSFDFEERRLGNDEDLPMHWVKVEGPGLPHYVNGHLSSDRAHTGKYSFRFDLNGGSLVYRYGSGQIPVRQGAHYRVEGYCHTTVLPNARARITAYFTDIDGHPFPSSICHSTLYSARQDNPNWQKLDLELTADQPEDAWLVLELELLQPTQYAPHTLGDRSLFTQDIRGSAWFDDIAVSQVPQVLLSTDHPGNIFQLGEPASMQILVSDRFTDDLAARLAIINAKGEQVFQRNGSLEMSSARTAGPGQKKVTLWLPQLPPGWYEASLALTSQGKQMDDDLLDFILLPDRSAPLAPDPRFGMIATDLPIQGWSALPKILPMLSAARVKLAVWSAEGDIEQSDPSGFDQLLEELQNLGISPTACLVDLPPKISEMVGGSWSKLPTTDPLRWQPQLAFMVSRHANHLSRWQLGADGTTAFVSNPQMRKVYAEVYSQFASLMDNPDLAMPWPAWYEPDNHLPATVAMSFPTSVLPNQLPLYIRQINTYKGHNLSLTIEPMDAKRYGRRVQIRDLAQRVIYALSAGAQRIDLPLPFTIEQQGSQTIQRPQELLLILRTLMTTLNGAKYQGKVPIAEGVEAFLFDRHGQGILALWDRGNSSSVKQLAINLGEHPAMIDLWGNVTPLPRTRGSSDSVQLSIGSMPMFLCDIDGPQAQLRASVAIDQPLLESSFRPHQRHITFVNPNGQPIAGTLHLRVPAGWTVNPPIFNFSLNGGEKFDREITLSFPYNSFAGAKILNCDFAVQGIANSKFTVPVEMRLGLSDVGMQTLALRDGDDVIVQQMVSNYGEQPINYSAFALVPDQARQERLVSNLAPGQTIIKAYRFTHVQRKPGATVRVGLHEMNGVRVLNDEVPIQ